MTYKYLCDEDMLLYLQLLQTGHSSDSLRDFSQLIISQYTTLYKEKNVLIKSFFDSTSEGWLILKVHTWFYNVQVSLFFLWFIPCSD